MSKFLLIPVSSSPRPTRPPSHRLQTDLKDCYPQTPALFPSLHSNQILGFLWICSEMQPHNEDLNGTGREQQDGQEGECEQKKKEGEFRKATRTVRKCIDNDITGISHSSRCLSRSRAFHLLALGFAFQEAWGGQCALHLNGLFVEEQRSYFSTHKKAWLIHFTVARKPRPVSTATMANFIASLRRAENSQLQLQNSNGSLFLLFQLFSLCLSMSPCLPVSLRPGTISQPSI